MSRKTVIFFIALGLIAIAISFLVDFWIIRQPNIALSKVYVEILGKCLVLVIAIICSVIVWKSNHD